MKGYVRSITYWAYCMEKLFLSMLGVVLMIFVIYAFMDAEGTNWQRWMTNYIPMLGFIFPVAGGMNMSNTQIPLALSSGSTRKEVTWGVIIMTHVIMLQFWIFAVICKYMLHEIDATDGYLRVCGVLFLVSCGIGNGLGAVILRFGSKVGMIIYIVMIFLIAGGVGVISVLSGLNAVLPLINSVGIFAAGAVFDVIMAIAFYCGIRRYEVRI